MDSLGDIAAALNQALIGAGFSALEKDKVRQCIGEGVLRLVENARLMGANAIVAMRFDTSEIGESLTEIVAYGTAVLVAGHP